MDDKIMIDKVLAEDLIEMLKLFDYERDEDSCMGMSFFEARISEDWFFANLFRLERAIKESKKNKSS